MKKHLKNLDNERIAKFKKLPNILIHGHTGSGKKTLVKMLLKEIYGDQVENLKQETYTIYGYGNSDSEVTVTQSNYHMIIEPNNSGIDKYIIFGNHDLEDIIRDMRIETGILQETIVYDIYDNEDWRSKQLERLKRELESLSPPIEDYDSIRPTLKEKASFSTKIKDWWTKKS